MNLVGTYTRFKRESKRFLSVYIQTILAPVFSNLLYLAIFGLTLNKTISNVHGISYLEFLGPGLIAMGIINNAYQNPSSSLIISKFQGHIMDLLTIPLKAGEILFAYIASALFRAFLIAIVTYITLSFFIDFHYASIFIIFLSILMISLFFAFLGFFTGIWAKDFDNIAFIQIFILTPMIYLGGVFYSIKSLPLFFQKISTFNPIVYMIDLLRYGFTGVHDFTIWKSLIILGIFNLIIGSISYYTLKIGWKIKT
ncbi:hypothetical protein A2335_04785 [Candidatus Peregrinibacteria bacterium RIFOXYB2_FULL_32_7]|nr:MAG: hypothetical protein A2335_04785 [Candidatus Peregrinibacteria bacterium RIFOXYB2_FULL_32_7]